MKNWLFLFLLLLVTSCVDEELVNGGSGDSIQLNLYVPASTTVSTRAMTEKEESAIKDLYVLVFDEDDNCTLVKEATVTDTGDNTKKTTSLILDKSNDNKSIVALANLKANKVKMSSDSWKGMKKEAILKSLVYTFSGNWNEEVATGEAWKAFPMWGEFEGTISASITINMLRALAKVNVIVNEDKESGEGLGLNNFSLQEVRVYYSYTDGYCAPNEDAVVGTEANTKVNKPSMYSSNQMDQDNFGKFGVAADEQLAFKNNIYLPEADNHKDGQKNVCLLIGGYYDDSKNMSYYRAAFQNSDEGILDILRNHLYKFNITSVTGPGSEDPEEALKKVDVNMNLEVTAWDETEMRDPNTVQYDLAVDKSAIIFSGKNLEGSITVLKPESWNVTQPKDNWFEVIKNADNTITINIKEENTGSKREGSFIVYSDQLKKEIKITQIGVETANCYIVSDKFDADRDLVVNIKGNGQDGLVADGKGGQHKFADQDETLTPTSFGIIWETVEGLVTITNPIMNKFGCIQYKVNEKKVGKGGNALIGAFDADGIVIWSWHIWIVPEYRNYEGQFEKLKLEDWVTGYSFMDRYLGAISNKPGSGSFGLLYQWGRKDPLVGVEKIYNGSSKNPAPVRANMYMHYLPNSTSEKYEWGRTTTNTIEESIKNPTKILSSGLCIEALVDGQYLWGTNQGLVSSSVGITNVGNKTIYDPCPAGYRVPPVDAYVFGDVKIDGSSVNGDNSYNTNWGFNNVFWPHNATGIGNNNRPDGEASFVQPNNTDSYGFWINYSTKKTKPTLSKYDKNTHNSPQEVSGASWLPLGGVYDGEVGMNSFMNLSDDKSSVWVNSIVWTNSPITDTNNKLKPAAMFLHGTESDDNANGRHFHRLNDGGSLASKTQYAGSVRCVRDKAKDYSSENVVPAEIYLKGNVGDLVKDKTFTTVNNRWEVINPGAKWFYVTPEEGNGGLNQELTFVATMANTSSSTREAVMTIRFYKEDGTVANDKKITVYQYPANYKFNVTSSVNLANNWSDPAGTATVDVDTNGQEWWVSDVSASWLSVSPSKNEKTRNKTLKVSAGYNYNSKRSASISITDGTTTRNITVTQNGAR